MKNNIVKFLFIALIGICISLASSCSYTEAKNDSSSDIILVASTPGDSLMKSMLAIPQNTEIDFIRWELTLKDNGNDSKTFSLNINFGIGKPNTNGFIGGGEKLSLEGKCIVLNHQKGNIYQLKSDKTSAAFSMIKLNDNLFHLLTPTNNLMVGNGGWSYTLNRKTPLEKISTTFVPLTNSSSLLNDTALQIVFDGRTPCTDFAKEYNLPVVTDCIKLKWRIIFNRDSTTFLPTTYTIKRTDRRQSVIEGKWSTVKGTATNPDIVIYQLDPDKPEKTTFLLAGDENVLFLLDKNQQHYVGNSDFSYTFNKKNK